jgi:hypothetical protein
MADAAYCAELRVAPGSLAAMPAGSSATIDITVRNSSDVVWNTYGLAVGNHWVDDRGRTVRLDDGRSQLPQAEIAPGASVTVPITISAPDEAGSYHLELDVVHEYVTWFADRGPSAVQVPVVVESIAPTFGGEQLIAGSEAPSNDSGPSMEMHFVPVDRVIAHLEADGLQLVDAAGSGSDGVFDYHRYVAVKPAHRTGDVTGIAADEPTSSPMNGGRASVTWAHAEHPMVIVRCQTAARPFGESRTAGPTPPIASPSVRFAQR